MITFASWNWLGTALHVAAFALVSLHVLRERRESSVAVLWILVAWGLPFFGPLAYLCFGINRVEEKGWRRSERDEILRDARLQKERQGQPLAAWSDARSQPVEEPMPAGAESMHCALSRLLPDHPAMGGNRIELLVTGDQAIPAMLEAIRAARHHIHLQSFIIGRGSVGHEVMELLAEKARSGVHVRLLYDRFGSTAAFLGGLFRAYRGRENLSIAGWTQANVLKRQFQVNLRNHRKILVVDGGKAFCGGVNLNLANRSRSGRLPIQDYHFALDGPIVHELQYSFMRDWHFMTGCPVEELLKEEYFPPLGREGHHLCRLVSSGPGVEYGVARDAVFHALTLADQQILAVTPYFVPPVDVLKALRAAALRGVDVRLVVPERNNHWFAGMASKAFYQELLEAGVRIFHRSPPFMHAKALVIDSRVAFVGTGNLDVRSLHLNYETNLAVLDEGFADTMKATVLNELAVSREIVLGEWTDRPGPQKLAENLMALLTPVL